jgi:hypothetical protein
MNRFLRFLQLHRATRVATEPRVEKSWTSTLTRSTTRKMITTLPGRVPDYNSLKEKTGQCGLASCKLEQGAGGQDAARKRERPELDVFRPDTSAVHIS